MRCCNTSGTLRKRQFRCPDWICLMAEGMGASRDHQSFFAGPIGRRAKALYYRHKLLGTAAVAPMIFFEAFLPGARRFFHHPERFPIADAHYAMGFAFLYELTADLRHLQRATHFLDELVASRCSGFGEYCWGYPSDWVTRNGVTKAQTPLITTTPYAYEAFLQVAQATCRPRTTDYGRSDVRGQRSPHPSGASVLRPLSSVLWICLTNTRKSSRRSRAMRPTTSRISRRRKRRAVVPILHSAKEE